MGNHCGFHSALALKKLDFDSVDITSTIIIVPFFRIMKSCLDFFVSHQIFDFLALTHPVWPVLPFTYISIMKLQCLAICTFFGTSKKNLAPPPLYKKGKETEKEYRTIV